MGIITKSARKYKYILDKGSKNYNPFFDGTVWTAENIDGLDDYVRLSSVERSETENSSAVSKKIITIPKTRLMSDFTKVCEQNIQPEFKKNDAVNETIGRNESLFVRNPFCDVPTHGKLVERAAPDDVVTWPSVDLATDDDGEGAWWSNREIEKFMQNYDVDHSLLWTDDEICKYTNNDKCKTKRECCNKCENDRAVEQKKEPKYENHDEIRSLVEDAIDVIHRIFDCLG